MWYYILGAMVFGKINGLFCIVDDTTSIIKNGYRFYNWWYYTPTQKMITNGPDVYILELQNRGTQTWDESSDDEGISSPEIILFEQPYKRFTS
jgi:hypothetical protein